MKIEGKLGLLVRTQIIGKDGKVKSDTGKFRGKCWTANMAAIMVNIWTDRYKYVHVQNKLNLNAVIAQKLDWDIQGQMISIKSPDSELAGILVGTDDTMPAAWDNINLGGFIDNGTGPGELTYGTMDYSDTPKIVDEGVEWTVYREFTNSSGGSITVKEIGLMAQYIASGFCLIARDILPSSQVVANGEVLRVFYTWRTEMGMTLQFLQLMAEIWTFRSKAALIKQVDGDSVAIAAISSWDSAFYPMNSLYAELNYNATTIEDGIRVGTGDTPVTLTDYTLDAPIAPGDGVGELIYGQQQVAAVANSSWTQFEANSDGDIKIRYERGFDNRSGAPITIKEIGFYMNYIATAIGNQAMILRKVLDVPVTVPINGYVRVLFSFVFPA